MLPHRMARKSGRAAADTLAERLGYPEGSKLLIVHADDLGLAPSVNAASIKAFETGLVTSGSIIVPAPWFSDMTDYARANPETDLGLHLTLTSEWESCRWEPVLPAGRVPSLVDDEGRFYRSASELSARCKPEEVEREIRAQIEHAVERGIRPTHLDCHKFSLFQNIEMFEVFLRVARDHALPIPISKEWFSVSSFIPSLISPADVVLDGFLMGMCIPPERWTQFYAAAIAGIQPGVTEILTHLGHDDEETRWVTDWKADFGAGWRQRDFDFFTSDLFRQMLNDNDIKLTTWRGISKTVG